jgi:hypothetical protein
LATKISIEYFEKELTNYALSAIVTLASSKNADILELIAANIPDKIFVQPNQNLDFVEKALTLFSIFVDANEKIIPGLLNSSVFVDYFSNATKSINKHQITVRSMLLLNYFISTSQYAKLLCEKIDLVWLISDHMLANTRIVLEEVLLFVLNLIDKVDDKNFHALLNDDKETLMTNYIYILKKIGEPSVVIKVLNALEIIFGRDERYIDRFVSLGGDEKLERCQQNENEEVYREACSLAKVVAYIN